MYLYLGELEIEVPKAPRGQEAVDVTYTYDINSLLEVAVEAALKGGDHQEIAHAREALNELLEDEEE